MVAGDFLGLTYKVSKEYDGQNYNDSGKNASRDAFNRKEQKMPLPAINANRETVNSGLYVRVSTEMQAERESLSTQESRLKAYCTANGFTVRDVYRDRGISAKDTDRPELQRLMEDCRHGNIQVVAVTALDRITRSLRDSIKLMDFFSETGVRFVSITQNIDSSTASGRLMRDILAVFAKFEREAIAERVASNMHQRATAGKWNGGIVPYGYKAVQRISGDRKVSELQPEPREAEIVKRIFETFLETRSLRKTTHILNSFGLRTRKGVTWAASTIHRILSNPTYVGKVWYGKRRTDAETGKLKPVQVEGWKVTDGQHQAIIPKKLFADAQEVLHAISRKPTRASHSYLLSGLLRCGRCGGGMYGYTMTKKSGKEYSYYKCHNFSSKGPSVCTGNTVRAKDLEDFIVKTLTKLSDDRPFLQDKEEMLAIMKEEMKPHKGKGNLERLKREEREIDARIETLLQKLESGLIDDSDFKRRYDAAKAQLRENRLAQEKALDSADLSAAAYESLNASFEEIASFGKNWEFLDDSGRQAKISAVVKQITVHGNKVDIQVFLDVNKLSRTGRDSSQRPA